MAVDQSRKPSILMEYECMTDEMQDIFALAFEASRPIRHDALALRRPHWLSSAPSVLFVIVRWTYLSRIDSSSRTCRTCILGILLVD